MFTIFDIGLLVFTTLVLAVPYTSSIELWLHKKIMHQPFGPFTYPYRAHAQTHHRIFRSDASYHLQREEHREKIRMAWWNSLIMVPLGTAIPITPLWFIMTGYKTPLIMTVTVFLFIAAYYVVYEYIHWCMHLPLAKKRWIESWPIVGTLFRKLNGHHLLHHRYPDKNLNVVLPLADFMFGSLLARSPIRFKQAVGHTVPDVQPISLSLVGGLLQ